MNFEEQLKWLENEYIPACRMAWKFVPFEFRLDYLENAEWQLECQEAPLPAENVSFRLPPQSKKTININGVEYVRPENGLSLPSADCFFVRLKGGNTFEVVPGAFDQYRRLSQNRYFLERQDAAAWAKMLSEIHGVGG